MSTIKLDGAHFWLKVFATVTLKKSNQLLAMDCERLALEWESSQEVRDHVRDNKAIITYPANRSFCEPTRANACGNAAILLPVLARMANEVKFRLPHLEPLQVEISILAHKLGLNLGEKKIYQNAVEIKKLAGFCKRRVARKEVTKDLRGHQNGSIFFLHLFQHYVWYCKYLKIYL